MSLLRTLFYLLLTFPVRLLVKCRIVKEDHLDTASHSTKKPIFYIVRNQSASDLLALQKTCKILALPDPLAQVNINGRYFNRTLCLEKPTPLFKWRKPDHTHAIAEGTEILKQHQLDPEINAQLVPVNIVWGRKPNKEKRNANVGTILADQESPSWLRKFFIVLFLGRNTMVRFSEGVSFRYMADKFGVSKRTSKKLLRVARFHFYRQTIAATGPRLMHRQQMFKTLLANPSIKKLLEDESNGDKKEYLKVKKEALSIMNEIAGDYRESMIRVGERVLHWLWHRIYNGIEVSNANTLRNLADEGHEIIYVPCHRSHMDYLLLTYIIYQQGLVTPRIAAGINLNFWPAGPIFRKAGAFFIRRSFRGNRLYSTIFREYLGLLFEKGYSVKFYSEGGRSRTGKLLAPKTGMLAMSIQSLLRGIDRPLTLVPVYLGYEHVMEVGTYHKELSGSKKKNESIFGVFKAIKNLRNYGKGYVNFGEPININQYLTQHVPDWKNDIDPIDPQKPSWLTPKVNLLADQVMIAINKCAALNGVSLIALILHATKNKAMARSELENQLDFFLAIQKLAPYSDQLTFPSCSGKSLLDDVIALDKVEVNQDSFGDIISLSESATLEMRYYRNNILHTFMLPALVCRILEHNSKINTETLNREVSRFISVLRTDLFLWQNEEVISQQVDQMLLALQELNIIKGSKAGFWSIINNSNNKANIALLSECANESLQRILIICSLVKRLAPVSKSELEEKVVSIAKRLSVLNNINAPEFVDKKAQALLIQTMRNTKFIAVDDNGKLIANSTLDVLKNSTANLIDISVLQSIAR
ncbi:glycerol-3-phosphate 1-O-acyltransferase PlsB [Thalassotalea piscium]|uniref:Glycerol-3-phosphate acyltransferase n=1 Tax=Thalassotalea piscium TaxID=1230533 RepID=A0A7X0TT60_9GAMM|nr:glycerol-3-phosphate 1-O-acyltransferase PlsB [Thalassotalea piscium]MBB6542818.1 glycerol-3-phosphate O-acyltransferase [Thalassotalea piscium]